MKRSRLSRSGKSGKRIRLTKVKPNRIEYRISEMLKENTGAHFLDSGGAYGRHWERNQFRAFAKEPSVKVDGEKDGDWHVDVSTYHFLTNHLTVSPESERLNNQLRAFVNKEENKDMGYLEIMEAWQKELFPNQTMLVDFYGDEDGQTIKTTNSYNSDNLLDQVIQWQAFKKDGKDFIVLQIHGGCDVRGGYTAPQVFQMRELSDAPVSDFIMSLTDVRASDGEHSWYSDDAGYNWYSDDGGDTDISKWRFDVKRKAVINMANNRPISFTAGWE